MCREFHGAYCSVAPTVPGCLLFWYFVDINILSPLIFCRQQYFVVAQILWRVIKLVEIKVACDQILRTFIKSVENKVARDQIGGNLSGVE